ncbi:MAG: hypothetical protein B6244_11610 [Candidatus Cloacimonetes bacterium 4572_55]|nr:MAG: hypothetical protein B6244_11610 [Candidatus Cloacimonetes bacterium 4572_55]
MNNIDATAGQGSQQIVGLTELMDARIDYLASQPEFQAEAPSILNTTYSPEIAEPNSKVWITTEVDAAVSVQLAYRHSVSAAFVKTGMFDDGNHNDGEANDHTYGVAIDVGATDVHFYIYAENDDAAMFDPHRAAYEFYTVPLTGDVAINEFLASNDSTAADQDGEFDDWVEFYNNSDAAISLSGYHLSDDGQELDKWEFPDISIAAHSFLIVWADNDEEQEGLHTNFKLSASGEAIYLTNASLLIVDEVTFGEQTTDQSTGRFPDGVGDFIPMYPTFWGPNISDVTSLEDNAFTTSFALVLQQNYPNPFNPLTTIRYQLPATSHAELVLYNVAGQKIRTLFKHEQTAGDYSVVWDGKDDNGSVVGTGVYFYRLQTDTGQSITRRMTLLK